MTAAPDEGAIDHDRLLAEIEAEARRLRESGEVDEALLDEMERVFESLVPDETGERDFASALDRAERESLIDVHPPADSRVPGGAPVKRAIKKLVLWYVDFVAGQVTNLAGSLTRAVRLLGGRVDDLDDRVERLRRDHESLRAEVRARATEITGHSTGADPSPGWADAIVERLAGVEGRVLHAECGDGDLLKRLADAGTDAYGADPRAIETSDETLDVRAATALDHLEVVGEETLGAVVLSGFVDRVTLGERVETLGRVAEALAPGGRLLVVGTDPATWADQRSVLEVDLAPGRPLHAETWGALLAAAGLDDVQVDAEPPVGVPASFLVSAVKAP